MTVITISRQLGSGGDVIAAQVCEQLGYRYFDKEMMIEAAANVGLCETEVVDFTEDRYKVQDFISRLLRARPRTVKELLVREEQHGLIETLTLRELNEEDCAALVRYTIERVHAEGNVVIVGRGGQAILKDKPNVVHVRIFAPQETRIQRLRARGMSGVSEIKNTIRDSDRASAEFLKRFFNIQWDDPEHYHLILNTGLLDTDTAAETIVAAARKLSTAVV